ncbi:DDE-type integrase/transposase/recombinase [Xenorhabdus santafensis]|uniref:DDE-type integrase/transposase/recombinase n=1 Tax=Xenorhabdus santafensis TaxID=2582833 RepID=UPI003F6BCBA8
MDLSTSPDAERVCRALSNALATRHIEGRQIFHFDQGSQYSSKKCHHLFWRKQDYPKHEPQRLLL